MYGPTAQLASAITRASSKQTYFTIRLLADRRRRADAFRAYAYFRWVDDVLDGDAASAETANTSVSTRARFLERQASLVEQCLLGGSPTGVNPQEAMLVDLVRHAELTEWGLDAYLRHMMRVMAFDAHRRGRLITQAELDAYSGWLAAAVTGAMHYFVGGMPNPPTDPAAYQAVFGAHSLHMLRDACEDIDAGYFNIPREFLEARGIGPRDINSDAYRDWVEHRVRVAKADLVAGAAYFAHVPNVRHRIAGLSYLARFRWLVPTIAADGFRLRPCYPERRRFAMALGMGWDVTAHLLHPVVGDPVAAALPRRRPS